MTMTLSRHGSLKVLPAVEVGHLIPLVCLMIGSLVWVSFLTPSLDRASLLLLGFFSALILIQASPAAPNMSIRFLYLTLASAAALVLLGLLTLTVKLGLLGALVLMLTGLTYGRAVPVQVWVVSGLLLLLAVPVPAVLSDWASGQLALLQAKGIEATVTAFGGTIERLGAQLRFGDHNVSINQDCSGFGLIAPALMGTWLAAAAGGRTFLGLVGLTAAALVGALGANMARLFVTSFAAAYSSADVFDLVHDGAGSLLMMCIWWAPIRLWAPQLNAELSGRGLMSVCLVAVLLYGAVLGAASTAGRSDERSLAGLPAYLDGWVGDTEQVSEKEAALLGALSLDRKLYRAGSNSPDRLVTHMTFASSRKMAEHSSAKCFAALGWSVQLVGHTVLADGSHLQTLTVAGLQGEQTVLELVRSGPRGHIRLQMVQRRGLGSDANANAWLTSLLRAVTDQRGQE